jgi:natural product precursor
MKRKRFHKRLSLNRTTVVNLNQDEMKNNKGGTTIWNCTLSCSGCELTFFTDDAYACSCKVCPDPPPA